MLKEKGLAHVPEDRQRMGLISDFKAHENLILDIMIKNLFKNLQF